MFEAKGYTRKNISVTKLFGKSFSASQQTAQSRLWCCLAVLVVVKDGTGEKEGTSLLIHFQ